MSTWNGVAWGKRWIDSLERLATAWQSRLPRGRDYAQKGHVISLAVTAGKVSARVQGSRSKPYTTTIEVPVFRDHDWDRAIRELVQQARFPAQLLAGTMPPELEGIFDHLHLRLFPVRNSEMIGSCTCPDKARPCKHIAAVHYGFGEALDRDPFLLLQLRGMDRAALMRALRRAWFGPDALPDSDDPVNRQVERGMQIMGVSADKFNRAPLQIESMTFAMRTPDNLQFVLHRLGAPVAWQLPVPIAALLGPVYEEASKLAYDIALADPSRDDIFREEDFDESALAEFDDGEHDEDLDDDDVDDENYDEDDDSDDDYDDDSEDENAEDDGPIPVGGFRTLGGNGVSMPPPASSIPAPTPAAPTPAAAAMFLPNAIGLKTQQPAPQPPREEEADRSAVMIRRGVASLAPRKRRTTNTSGDYRVVAPDGSLTPLPVPRPEPVTPAAPAAAVVRRRRDGDGPVAPPAPAPEAVRTRARSVAGATTVASVPSPAADEAQSLLDIALDAYGRRQAARAQSAARRAWDARQSPSSLIVLLAASDLDGIALGAATDVCERLTRELEDRPRDIQLVDALVMMASGAYDDLCRQVAACDDRIWSGHPPIGTQVVAFALAALLGPENVPSATQLESLWDDLSGLGDDLFPGAASSPPPFGLYLASSLGDRTPTEAQRRKLLETIKALAVSAARRHRDEEFAERLTIAARTIVAALEGLKLLGRASEANVLLTSVRRELKARSALARALDDALDSTTLDL
jgi:uncharacterized Zn finger protein